jgi:hypothetical protein
MDAKSVQEQLGMMKDLTKKFDVLHESQIIQLRYWPYISVEDLKNHEFKVDIEAKTIVYTMYGTEPSDSHRMDFLTNNIKWLLGAEWEVSYIWKKG